MMNRKCKIFHVFLFIASCLLTTDYAYSQWRDSSTVIIQTPAGKRVKVANFATGDTTFKTGGGIGYKSGSLYFSDGTSWYKLATTVSGGSVGNADSLGGVPASGYVRTTTDQNINGYKSFLDSIIVGVNSSLAGIVRFEGGNTGVGRLTTSLGNQNRTWTLPDQTGTILVNGDTTTFRTRSDSLYNRVDLVDIVTTPDYYTARQYMTSLALDTLTPRTLSTYIVAPNIDIVMPYSFSGTSFEDGQGIYFDNSNHGDSISYGIATQKTTYGRGTELNLSLYNLPFDGRFIQWLRVDSAHNINFNHLRSNGTGGPMAYGDVYVRNNNLLVSSGYVDSDSIRDDATTRATSGAWHSGLGAWSLGNITTGTISGTSGTFSGAVSGTTGTFSSQLQFGAGSFGTSRLYTDATNGTTLTGTTATTYNMTFSRPDGTIFFRQKQGTSNVELTGDLGVLGDTIYATNATMVGIGTASPTGNGSVNLHLNGTTSPRLRITNPLTGVTASDGFDLLVSSTDGTVQYLNREATEQRWYGAGSLRMILDNSGSLTLGSTDSVGSFPIYAGAISGTTGTFSGSGSFGGSASATSRLTVRNGLLANIAEFYNSRGTLIAKVDSNGAATLGSSGSAFTAKVDSNAMEFTSSSVEYRAMQTAYAKLYHDTTTAYSIALGTADSFYTIKNWNQSLGMRKNMTITDSSIVIRVAGVYQVQYALSSSSTSANTVLQTSIFQNFSRKGETSAQQKIATANDIGNMAGLGVMYCNAGDYIQLRVRRASGAGSCEVTEGQLVVTRID